MIGPFATDMYLPSFHEMTDVFGVPLSGVQQTLSSYLNFPLKCALRTQV